MIHLSARLMAIAEMIPAGARVCDVGTDHGRLPVWLLQNGISSSVTATDLHEQPLKRAEALLRRCGLTGRAELRRCDGLSGFTLSCFDVVVIAGLSGKTIAAMLPAAGTPDTPLFLLQPVTRAEHLRGFLFGAGYAIRHERLALDGGRLYPVIAARGADGAFAHGAPQGACPDTLYLSEALLSSGEPLLPRYLQSLTARLTTEACALEGSKKPEDVRRLALHRRTLAAIGRTSR